MLYNIDKQHIQTDDDCFTCQHFDLLRLKCDGYNKTCFEYDEATKTVIDGITHLPLTINKKGE